MSGGVPAGWVLVPVEPTEAMVKVACVAIEKAEPDDLEPGDAGFFWGCSWMTSARDAWSAMLAATPTTQPSRDADVERVEKVARAIDPDVWIAFDSDRAFYPADPKERFYAYPRVAASLDKARAALQALTACPEGQADQRSRPGGISKRSENGGTE